MQRQGPQFNAAHVEGEGSPISPRHSYVMQRPSAPVLPAAPPHAERPPLSSAEHSACEDVAVKVRGIAQDIGVLSDAYCAGPANDAPDPAKLGHVLGRWEDRLVAVADELDRAGVGAPDDEGEGEDEGEGDGA